MSLILVVDDSEDNLILMMEFLTDLGHECRLANSGKMALEIISLESIDLIISDLQMEDGDGLWLLSKLKDQSESTKCIIVSSDSSHTDEFYRGIGAAGFFSKPLNWEHFKLALERLL